MSSVLARRITQIGKDVNRHGGKILIQRIIRRVYRQVRAAELDFPLLPGDVADSSNISLPSFRGIPRGKALRVGWLATPPAAGSGGHTTMFRMVEALEAAGHSCTLYLYDRHGSPASSHEQVIRDYWPNVKSRVGDVNGGMLGSDVYIATSWETAQVLATRNSVPGKRMYFIQDYEPFFYPRGSVYALAEDTYRFGFQCIALGHMVADCLRREVGVPSDFVPFGCDNSVYKLVNRSDRSGVVFYTKPDVARRGYHLAVLGLAEFHREHPDQPIHVYGERTGDLPFPVVRHARLSPNALNKLYNESIAGIAMSFTNISLVAEEMLAAGAIPIVNESIYSRADLTHPMVGWAKPTPGGIARALAIAVTNHSAELSVKAASAVRSGWSDSQSALVKAVEAALYAD